MWKDIIKVLGEDFAYNNKYCGMYVNDQWLGLEEKVNVNELNDIVRDKVELTLRCEI